MAFIAYTDGSFREEVGKGTWAYILLRGGKMMAEAAGQLTLAELQGSRNIAAELKAAEEVIKFYNYYAPCFPGEDLTVFHDYEGVGKWATGEWRAKKSLTRQYAEMTGPLVQRGAIKFVQVRGHSGNHWNNYVDRLCWGAYD